MESEQRKILTAIANYLDRHPSQRFGQALFNLRINEFNSNSDPSLRDIYSDTDQQVRERIGGTGGPRTSRFKVGDTVHRFSDDICSITEIIASWDGPSLREGEKFLLNGEKEYYSSNELNPGDCVVVYQYEETNLSFLQEWSKFSGVVIVPQFVPVPDFNPPGHKRRTPSKPREIKRKPILSAIKRSLSALL